MATEFSYFLQVTKPYCALPASSGRNDLALLALAKKIDLSESTLFLDYGCGQGRLLAALAETRRGDELRNLRYIGVDLHPEPLSRAHDFFSSTLATTGASGCFVCLDDFRFDRFIVDQAAVIFAVHELDPVNLDRELSKLWRMLRRGGKLFVQDTAEPIHHEIEFIALAPDRLCDLLHALHGVTAVETVVAGRRQVPVFLVTATKPTDLSRLHAYSLHDLAARYRAVLHRSVLRDCLALLATRTDVELGRVPPTNSTLALWHRLAVCTRAFHQTLAMDEVNSGRAIYCVGCGSSKVSVDETSGTAKDPYECTITCADCGYEHHFDREPGARDEAATRKLFEFLEKGSTNALLAETELATTIASLTPDLRPVVVPSLKRIPDLAPGLLESLIGTAP